jgi:hypothetical protein
LEAEAAGEGGAAVLEVVEAGGDAGGVEGPVGVGKGEPVEVRAEQPVVDLAGPLGHPCELAAAERRHLDAHAELVAGQPVGHAEADESFDGPPRPLAARDRRAQAEALAELAQVDHGWFAFAPQHGQAPKYQQRRRADDPGPGLFDVRVIELNPTLRTFRVGVGQGADDQCLRWFHASLGPPAPPTARPSSSWPT